MLKLFYLVFLLPFLLLFSVHFREMYFHFHCYGVLDAVFCACSFNVFSCIFWCILGFYLVIRSSAHAFISQSKWEKKKCNSKKIKKIYATKQKKIQAKNEETNIWGWYTIHNTEYIQRRSVVRSNKASTNRSKLKEKRQKKLAKKCKNFKIRAVEKSNVFQKICNHRYHVCVVSWQYVCILSIHYILQAQCG